MPIFTDLTESTKVAKDLDAILKTVTNTMSEAAKVFGCLEDL